jgi:Pyruvate/2-oxoacid:ferredoxin oxidoreductase gamma subunit
MDTRFIKDVFHSKNLGQSANAAGALSPTLLQMSDEKKKRFRTKKIKDIGPKNTPNERKSREKNMSSGASERN